MAVQNFKSVDDYIAAQPEPARGVLQKLRATIRKAVPGATELIAYGMPGYKLDGAPLLYFAAWKQHFALYPGSSTALTTFRKELAKYEVDKGTIRFPLDAPVPVKLVTAIAKFRAEEVAERVATKRERGTA